MSVIAITYPLALPTTPAPVSTDINLVHIVGRSRSKFNASRQVQDWGGAFWRASVSLPAMLRATADPWLAFFSLLHGVYGTFLMGDWDRRTPRGTIAGTVLVKGADQTGNGLAVDGATPATTLLKGDHIQVENRLYRVVADLTFDGSGEGIIQVEPRLRSAPADNAVVTYTSPKGLFALTSNVIPSPSDFNGVHQLSFDAEEAL